VLEILSGASAIIAEGEVLQLQTSNDTSTSEQAYLDVICSKTAALFAAACRIGAVVADRPKAEEEALDSFGRNLGIAFQLIDDVLDYAAAQPELGKTVGDDFRDGKITLPVILAFRRGDAEERSFWRRTLEDREQKDGDLAHALNLMQRHGTLRDAVARAAHYGAIARDALGIFPDGPEKRALLEAVDFPPNGTTRVEPRRHIQQSLSMMFQVTCSAQRRATFPRERLAPEHLLHLLCRRLVNIIA
jgi:octaprenyl-diphosphate synthase